MKKVQIERMEEQLISFINRVVDKENATPAEIAALPEIAKILFRLSPELEL